MFGPRSRMHTLLYIHANVHHLQYTLFFIIHTTEWVVERRGVNTALNHPSRHDGTVCMFGHRSCMHTLLYIVSTTSRPPQQCTLFFII